MRPPPRRVPLRVQLRVPYVPPNDTRLSQFREGTGPGTPNRPRGGGGDLSDPHQWGQRMERMHTLRAWVVENLEAAREAQAPCFREIGDQIPRPIHYREDLVADRVRAGGPGGDSRGQGACQGSQTLPRALWSIGAERRASAVARHPAAEAAEGHPGGGGGVMEDRAAFNRRWGPLYRWILQEYPGFWEALRGEMFRQMRGPDGPGRVTVADWPESMEAGSQTEPVPRRSRGTQADWPGACTEDVATQTESGEVRRTPRYRDADTQTEGGPADREEPRPEEAASRPPYPPQAAGEDRRETTRSPPPLLPKEAPPPIARESVD
ncbi:PREDICTED: uncharacterized protein LOC105556461, partial [Vollenhovia emeryi]|uniref:uncharacterized protein LOC105556461 n=1 Tax=Vollenhovia emeryi TaxID=411798 RepID=UPI0005F3ED60